MQLCRAPARRDVLKAAALVASGLDLDVAAENDRRDHLCATGGKRIDRAGSFYAPTVLVDIPKGSPAYREELFGPVASVFRVKNIDEAIQVANDTRFGLGASAWTNDPAERERFVNEIDAGMVYVNLVGADSPELPFGGFKRSGFGRELGRYGADEFVNKKLIRSA